MYSNDGSGVLEDCIAIEDCRFQKGYKKELRLRHFVAKYRAGLYIYIRATSTTRRPTLFLFFWLFDVL
jgi:hypothetical protein